MKTLHTDRGRELLNEELMSIAEFLQIKQTSTAAYIPNANGCNERNRIMVKTLTYDPDTKPEVALAWCINAKNTLQNVNGFSPAQIVYGRKPKLPTLLSAGPPGIEKISISKAPAQHIDTMHRSREAFIESEPDRSLKSALKQRFFKGAGDISVGDCIYYKNSSKWEGLVKIHSKNGKLLYSVRANKLLTINFNHVMLTKADGVFGVRNEPAETSTDKAATENRVSDFESNQETRTVTSDPLTEALSDDFDNPSSKDLPNVSCDSIKDSVLLEPTNEASETPVDSVVSILN